MIVLMEKFPTGWDVKDRHGIVEDWCVSGCERDGVQECVGSEHTGERWSSRLSASNIPGIVITCVRLISAA